MASSPTTFIPITSVASKPITSPAGLHYFERFDFLLLPAFFNAIATACFCGLPALISVLMFELTVL